MNGTLRELREEKGLTQSELATKLGVTQGMIHLLEKGERGASDSLKIKYANFFNKSIEELFFTNRNYFK